ncbi:RNA 2',3'-cyclic phosphodiesterase [Bacillus pseudomycoides]|uniref:RNA 2',3'-cyclic phosphodiesterase n=1 Tax=Bacillus pseudomycoides TaxID=64104 RepID=UPI000BEE71B1|nr:RNA 2',3'-cyclic phosphodiesterase [Bacillus pseudomycoides]PEE42599.1 RNA 2',3'-cyclic phosphodiesterase [Bacillus pseudomycoides]PGA93448.1 RNA 2',3'-cyclic phosphodiesterase [Bacillus pseudomycoides]PHF50890.1 RNA 2',3'-cyclic phosphodiesterase [Bacillus pseudomycoides]
MVPHYFLAVTLPDHIKEILENYKEEMKDKLPFHSWVYKEDYHITLAFLGSATQEQLQGIEKGLQLLTNKTELDLTLQNFSTFGLVESPRIFWAGLKEYQALFDMQKQVYAICERNGFSLETRPYHPHITVARKWMGEETFNLKDLKQLDAILFQADTITLYESHVHQTPKYKSIYEIKLQNPKV